MTLYVRPLSDKERARLDEIITEPFSEVVSTRAHIVLLSSQGYKSTEIAPLVGRHQASVRKWIRRFNVNGLSSLINAPSPGRKRSYTDEQAQKMVEIALTKPRDLGQPFSRWSLHRLMNYLINTKVVESISHDTVWRILGERGIHFQKGQGWVRSD
ncbi:MAG: hypothetical protein B6I34_02290 [Anaerolineaceae bacterium 4572_32.1]|nr:MAG: hypothetical protein B6I34_02290 [Anaerolineaceae bacterium 4572_32.1]